MANYDNLKATIAANVYPNMNHEVTALMVRTSEYAIVDALSILDDKVSGLALGKFYGFFPAAADLPAGDDEGYAYVGASAPFTIYVFNGSSWRDSGSVYSYPVGNGDDIDTNAAGQLQFANRPSTYGMGYKILRRDASFASQVGDSDTIYEIRYDFDLNGGSAAIPSGCVLLFNGGSISNGELTLNDTYISGPAKFACSLSGSVKNELFNALWIDAPDLGTQVNTAASYFDNIVIPAGIREFSVPIKVSGMKIFDCKATLVFTGTPVNCVGVVVIEKENRSSTIRVRALKPGNGVVTDYTDSRTVNAVGLEIRDINGAKIEIGQIENFNENLRVSSIYAMGCCYNQFYIGCLNNGNFNIRLYQQNYNGNYSWVNENTFNGGRLTNFTNSNTYGRCYNVGIGGPAIDLVSYKDGTVTDTYDVTNAISFKDMSMEGSGSGKSTGAILARNAEMSLVRIREEGIMKYVVTNGTRFSVNQYVHKYDSRFWDLSDFSATSRVVFPTDELVFKQLNEFSLIYAALNKYIADGIALVAPLNTPAIPTGIFSATRVLAGIILDTSTYKLIFHQTRSAIRHCIMYLDANGNNITTSSSPVSNYYDSFSTTYGCFVSGNDERTRYYRVPSAITRVFVGVYASNRSGLLRIGVPSSSMFEAIPNRGKFGATSERPSALPLGVAYFDTTLGKPIYYNGTGWVDAAGNAV